MNNQEFRKLLLANSSKSSKTDNNGASPLSSASRPAAALGSRLKSSIPMTPRSLGGKGGNSRVDFAKQLAEQNKQFEKTQKKFRTSAPKGSRFAEGYVDRAKQREQEEEDERAERLKALEEAYKKEEIDKETYDRTRSQIAGGDLSSTHLVKGLDFALLRRIKQGEDVWDGKPVEKSPEGKDAEPEEEKEKQQEDLDDVFEKLAETEVKAVTREKVQKKGQFATTTLNPGQKRSRNQLLAELKAAREAAKAKEESSLGSKFKKIGAKKVPGTRIEKDSMGREIQITVDEDGHEVRKIRKVDHKLLEEEQDREAAALASRGVLGMEVPEFYKKQQEETERAAREEEESKEISIFDDVGSDYDPLAALEGSDSSSEEEEEEEGEARQDKKAKSDSAAMPPPPKLSTGPPEERDYFKNFRGGKVDLSAEETYKAPSLDDPLLQAALKKAKAIGALEKSEEEIKAKEREERLKKKLQESLRDDEDMDMGFGSSRMEDDADFEEKKVKLSAWGDDAGDDDEYEGGGGDKKEKRKRGGKKRKGDKNNFEDVMKVIERRKAGS
ncbi:hypothetical protein QBC36DRAFT_329523 [Triangularia setosa]|uniref:RED-like N-terminal domain-containing protein n=1 Tax=Triangularia setosa TaxID=2587417 RepID=A0AAN7A7M3_9PEZI|nr:hypothetical protein QBC36DRAFT_329523 [Podospora setosa]